MSRTGILSLTLAISLAPYAPATGASVTAPEAAQQSGNDFRWNGRIQQGRAIEIKGINGDVDAVLAPGDQVEVVARKHGRRNDPASVEIMVIEHGEGVTICAVYPTPVGRRGDDGPNECRPGEEGRMNVQNNDVQVDFTVRVPAAIRFVGRNVNGSVEASSLRSDVEAYTVNGRVAVSTTGTASAESVNGSIDATIGATRWDQALDFRTVNGSITLTMPAGAGARVRAETMNGGITSDFPMTIETSRREGRRITGTLGAGGGDLLLSSVNGGIRLRSSSR